MAQHIAENTGEKIPGLQFPENGRFMLSMRRDPLSALQRLFQTYGDVAHVKLGKQDAYLLSNPEDIRDVLVVRQQQMRKPDALRQPVGGNGLLRSEGEFHKHQRRLIQPAFHRQRIASYAQTMVEYTRRLSGRWQDGMQVDMAQEMMGLTLAIIAQTMFGAQVEDDTEAVREALTPLLQMGGASRFNPLDMLLEYLPLPSKKRRLEARAQMDAIVYRIIDERRASGEDRETCSRCSCWHATRRATAPAWTIPSCVTR
ncbi:cytochrome P450 [Dictyobacter kobayashii]|uniref:Cytochrome P450 n=1 Tax=Dictyobacter kobayashii TaxID=2014872 RepID=A0A402AQY3_9CHLR|nr:cytochrome P450 [Dictyobacter kobayashii]GCE21509.1 hypothetical protein KDK_53090 [Dictyobacter kobayashii]